MTRWESILTTICQHPLDDGPREVAADYLEEQGDPRGEFIRTQLELAKPHPQGLKPSGPTMFGETGREFHKYGKGSDWGRRRSWLERRERELLRSWIPGVDGSNAVRWMMGLGLAGLKAFFNESAMIKDDEWFCGFTAGATQQTRRRQNDDGSRGQFFVKFRRGFVSDVTCLLADWFGGRCERCVNWARVQSVDQWTVGHPRCGDCNGSGQRIGHGPQICKAAPIESVKITDKRPVQGIITNSDNYFFVSSDSSLGQPGRHWSLPMPIFRLLPSPSGYRTEADAMNALSRAAILWAKSVPVTTAEPVVGRA